MWYAAEIQVTFCVARKFWNHKSRNGIVLLGAEAAFYDTISLFQRGSANADPNLLRGPVILSMETFPQESCFEVVIAKLEDEIETQMRCKSNDS